MTNKEKKTRGEVDALRQEVKNLASALNTAVDRIQELETGKDEKPKSAKQPQQALTLQEEVEALRGEVKNLATALDKAVTRVRELEDK